MQSVQRICKLLIFVIGSEHIYICIYIWVCFYLKFKNNQQTRSAYSAYKLDGNIYLCVYTTTCPYTNDYDNGYGDAYKCCSTDNCNNGTVAFTVSVLSCYIGTGSDVTPTVGCTTNLCQVRKRKFENI